MVQSYGVRQAHLELAWLAIASLLLWTPRLLFAQQIRPGDERPELKESTKLG